MAPTPLAISVTGLVKRFGATTALRGIDLHVPVGTIYGLIGPNGAGKTTALRIIAGLLNPTDGRVAVLGHDLRESRLDAQACIGFLPGEVRLYGDATGGENLDFLAGLHRLPPIRRAELTERLELPADVLDRKVRTFSRGMQQKLGLVAAMQHDPPILVLDEPSEGLDPLMQATFVELIEAEARRGKTVLLSSHALSEIERTCERMAMVRRGEIIFEGTLADVRRRALRTLDVVFREPVDVSWSSEAGVVEVEGTPRHHIVTFTGNPGHLLARVVDLPVEDLTVATASLETSFLSYYRGGPPTPGAVAGDAPAPAGDARAPGQSDPAETSDSPGQTEPDPRRRLRFVSLATTAWRRHRTLRWSLAAGTFLMGLLLAGTYEAFGSGLIPQSVMDDFADLRVFRAFSGTTVNMLSPEGWLGFGYVHPLTLTLVVAWIVAGAAAAVAREIEDGTIEFLGSRPVDRRTVLGARAAAWALGMAAVLGAMYLGTVGGIVFFDALADFSPLRALYFPLSLVPLVICIGGLGFLVSSAVSSRSRVFAIVVGVTVASYFLNFAAGLWDPLESLRPLSIFNYVAPAEWALYGVDWAPAALMTLLGLALGGAALLVIDRRDIAR